MAYTNATFYIDLVNGVDTARTALTTCIASNPSGSTTRINKVGHGLVTGAVVDLTAFTAWLVGAWKITKVDNDNFDLDGAVWQATADANGNVTPRGGSSWTDAWKTFTAGATAARTQAGDTVRVAKSAAPISIGNGTWTSGSITARDLTSRAIQSSTNASPIVVTTTTAHGFSSGDIVFITTHSTNTNANGTWKITVLSSTTFSLADGTGTASVGNGVGGLTGTASRITPRCVKLASSTLTKPINDGESQVAWTASNSAVAARTGIATDAKWGDACIQITAPAVPATNTLYARWDLSGSIDYSAYNAVSFWLKPQATTTITAGRWSLCLCSDAAATTIVNRFDIPAQVGTRWRPLTIYSGSLGNSIRSVALYSNTVAPAASQYLRLDNIMAVDTGSIRLDSLISKNSTEQGGAEQWYPIQGMYGEIVVLDMNTNTTPTNQSIYEGASETVTTYIRQPIPVAQVAADTTVSNQLFAASTYSGGWNTSTDLQDGETFFDAQNGHGITLYEATRTDTRVVEKLSTCRGFYGYQLATSGRNLTINDCRFMGHSSNAVIMGSATNTKLNRVFVNGSGTGASGINLSFVSNVELNGVKSNNGLYGIQLTSCANTTVVTSSIKNNTSTGFLFSYSGNVAILSGSTSGNPNSFTPTNSSNIRFERFEMNETTEAGTIQTGAANYIASHEHDNAVDTHIIYTDGGSIISQTAERNTPSGIAWEISVTAATRGVTYPIVLPVAKIACAPNKLVTATVYIKKSTASAVGAQLVCRGNQVGVGATVSTTAADNTNWQQLTLTFTPTEKNVIELEVWGYYVSGTGDVFVDDMTLSQEA